MMAYRKPNDREAYLMRELGFDRLKDLIDFLNSPPSAEWQAREPESDWDDPLGGLSLELESEEEEEEEEDESESTQR